MTATSQNAHTPPQLPSLSDYQTVTPELEDSLKKRVASFMNIQPHRFPGAQPVSFQRSHIETLMAEHFFVSEKADGIRCLLYTEKTAHGYHSFLIDRKNKYYFVPNLMFPRPSGTNSEPFYDCTLLDGELILDIYENGHRKVRFLLFDLVVLDGDNVTQRPYDIRLGKLRDLVLKPYIKYMSFLDNTPDGKKRKPTFSVELKPLQLAYHTAKVFEDMLNVHHGTDGVIFTSKSSAYAIGTCQTMIKWKPAEENTVDFRIEIIHNSNGPQYLLQTLQSSDGKGPKYQLHGSLTLEPEMAKSWLENPPKGRIAECRYDPSWPGTWRFMRWRDDKSEPNYIKTFESVMESIRHAVSKDELLAAMDRIRENWRRRDPAHQRPSPPSGHPTSPSGASPNYQNRHLQSANAKQYRNDPATQGNSHHDMRAQQVPVKAPRVHGEPDWVSRASHLTMESFENGPNAQSSSSSDRLGNVLSSTLPSDPKISLKRPREDLAETEGGGSETKRSR